jgi:hypothetical protein
MGIIWIIKWHTESGDEGVDGYYTVKPTDEQIKASFRRDMPGEFEDGEDPYIYWKVIELTQVRP